MHRPQRCEMRLRANSIANLLRLVRRRAR